MLVFSSVFGVLLAGCGGGGGGSGGASVAVAAQTGTNPTAAFPLDAAVSAYHQASHNDTLTAIFSPGNTFTLQLGYVPGTAQQIFEGRQASTGVDSGTLSLNGVVLQTSSATSYFTTAPFTKLGSTSSNGHYSVTANWQALPVSATVGQSGPVDTTTTYTDNTKAAVYSTDTTTWSLVSDTPTTVWFCSNTTVTAVAVGATSSTGFSCLKINQAGVVLGRKVSILVNGQMLTFQ
ncbi:MAG: hypothetical protein K2P57_13410 [Burkholderiales bacterium]|nr:hypothetical protein [Burkholderiales bacterium]